MSKFIKLVIVSLILSAFVPVCGMAANRLINENFDDKAIDSRLTPRIYGAVAAPPQYTYAGPGRDGKGSCLSSGTVAANWLQWTGGKLPKPWPSDEMYISFWMRYPTFTNTDPNENIKFFYPHWNGIWSYVHYCMYTPNDVYYAAFGMGRNLASGVYLRCPNQTDGNWHHYEFYVKFSEGISRFWYDGVQKLDQRYGPGVWTNDISTIDAPSMDGEEPGVFTRQVDDLEIWDGMPGSRTEGPPSSPADISVRIIG